MIRWGLVSTLFVALLLLLLSPLNNPSQNNPSQSLLSSQTHSQTHSYAIDAGVGSLVMAADCGGHGQPACDGVCDPGLQLCDAPDIDGMCYWCCEDVTDRCGNPPGDLLCQNDDPNGLYYDPDCTDQELCSMSGDYWIEENSWVSPAPSGYFACCDANTDCVTHGAGVTGCNNLGDIFFMNPGESSICGGQNRVLACTGLHNPGVNEVRVGTTVAGACCNGPYDNLWTSRNHWTRTPQAENSWSWTGYDSCADGADNDCDGLIDCQDLDCASSPVCQPICTDKDGDGYYAQAGCGSAVDCNDNDPTIYPGAPERCNNRDDDCDRVVDEGFDEENCTYTCQRQGYVWTGNGGDLNCCGNDALEDDPYQVVETLCDGHDNDCDGLVDEGCGTQCTDADGDGYAVEGGQCGPIDCDDTNASINPGAVEVCDNEVDDNCNGLVDCDDQQCSEDPACDFCTPYYDYFDYNDDALLNGTDAQILLEIIVTNSTCPAGKVCDVNGDGTLSPADATRLLLIINGDVLAGEICDDLIDNDCDGLIDGDDPDCQGDCGDGIIQPGEQCDGSNWGPITGCVDFDSYTGGDLSCDPVTCLFDVSQCVGGNSSGVCGDGVINSGEQCDGNPGDPVWDWGPIADCTAFDDFTGGALSCNPTTCQFDTSQCVGESSCVDADGDGYNVTGGLCGPVDCDDMNASIHPGAVELCNGVDDNCNGEIDEGGVCGECQTDDDCPPVDCPSINGTLNGTCDNGVCTYDEPPFGCITECSDNIDNDNDGYIDFDGGDCLPGGTCLPDPGCTSFADDDETNGCYNDSDCVDVCPPGTPSEGWPWQGSCVAGECEYNDSECQQCHPYYYYYDYDNNGMLNGDDVSLLVSVVFGAACPSGYVCDVNDDGDVNAQDVIMLASIISGSVDAGEICDDLIDNNCNGLIDGDDPDCQTGGQSCTDTDGGVVPLVQGNVTVVPPTPSPPVRFFEDFCLDASTLVEYFCDAQNESQNMTIPCQYGCVDGACLPGPQPTCGDGIIQPGETCDGQNWGPVTGCSDFDNFTGGSLSCDPLTCQFDTSLCTGGNETGYCGDGVINTGETCDGSNWGNITGCQNFDSFTGGALSCDDTCHFNTSLCEIPPTPFCGDGVIQPGEQCDFVNDTPIYGDLDCTDFDDFTGGVLGCDPVTCQALVDNCTGGTPGICGDGVVNVGEQCDGTNFSGLDCTDFDSFTGGVLTCNPDCTANTSACLLPGSCTDADGDGYAVEGGQCGPIDCDDTNPAVNPGALEICNQIDDNCNGLIDEGGVCGGGVCGDGIIQPGETCDGQNWGPVTGCSDFDNFTGGTLSCDPVTCHFNTDQCTGGNETGYCGDGVINTGETCDGSNWGNITGCADFDSFTDGSLTCDGTCHFNTSLCELPPGPYCGDGTIDPGEQCEVGGNWGAITGCTDFDNFTGGSLSCDLTTCLFNTSQCTSPHPFCGDGVIQPGEQCDFVNDSAIYGNLDCTDFDDFTGGVLGCDPVTCQALVDNCTGGTPGICGDGVVNVGEQCDGTNFSGLDCTDFDSFTGGVLTCNPDCTANTSQCTSPQPFCGDGVIQPGEQCDGSNWGNITDCTDFDNFTGGALTCDPVTCLFDTTNCEAPNQATCGDGVVNQPTEQCDGSDFDGRSCGDYGYNNGHLSCTASCTISTSGCYNSGGGGGGGGGHGGGGHGGGGSGDCINGYVKVDGVCVKQGSKPPTPICDADGDGYVRYAPACIGKGLGTDCDDHDRTVHPGAQEVCGNGKDDNCNGKIDEGCVVRSPLSYNRQIRVPILSIIPYDVTVANLGTYDLRDTTVSLDLPSNLECDGVKQLGTLRKGESRHVRFAILVSEDITPTEHFTITVRDGKKVIATGEVTAQVEIPPFAVRIKPSLNGYSRDGEVYVLLNNREPKRFDDLEVELDVNQGRTTEYVQYLGVFDLKPFQRFRYRYTYPVDHLESPAVVVGYLRQHGALVATSDDTLATVYHPTRFDKDARTLTQIGLNG